jgi:hypothetical protein
VTLTRDPLSEAFDDGARRLLDRAYARPREWHTTRLTDPSPADLIKYRAFDPSGPDPVAGGRYRSRWGRAFARAIYYQHRNYSPHRQAGPWRKTRRTTVRRAGSLLVEAGKYKPAVGVIPRGLSFRVMLTDGGHAKAEAVDKLPASQRWAGPAGHGPAAAQLGDRDWGESAGHGHTGKE